MDHRPLINALSFLLGFLLIFMIGLATAADPIPWWYHSNDPTHYVPTPESDGDSRCRSVYSTEEGSTYRYLGTFRIEYQSPTYAYLFCTISYFGGAGYEEGVGNYNQVMRCWDGLEPVGGVCPEPPMCQSGLTLDWFFTQRAALPSSVCDKQSCRWDQAGGVSLCLPEDLTCVGAYTSTGDYCQGFTITLDAQPLDKPFAEYIDPPVTETTVDKPAPAVNGDTVTEQSVTTTETDRALKIERTFNDTTVTETGIHGVSKTTTTTTTTHADGSKTITETVSYERTDPSITTTRIGVDGSVTTEPGKTVTGSRTTTSVVGADGSVTSTTTESGVGGDGEGGPESDDGECGILPQVVCDFLSGDGEGEEHPGLPADEVGGEMVAYDSGLGGGSCPGSVGASFMGQSISYDYSDACYVATTYFRPILLAIAAIAAAFIIVGARL